MSTVHNSAGRQERWSFSNIFQISSHGDEVFHSFISLADIV